MNGETLKQKNKIFSLPLLGLGKYFYSFLFPLVVALFTALCFIGNITGVGIGVFVLVASFIVVTNDDLSLLLPLLFCFPPLLRTIDFFSHLTNYLYFAPFIVCLITHFIRFPIKKIVIGKLFFPLLAFTCALFLGGILYKDISKIYKDGLPHILSVGVAIFAEYFVLSQKIKPPKDVDFKSFFSKTLVSFGIVSCIELFYMTLTKNLAKPGYGLLFTDELGWCNVNHVGYIIMLCLASCFYLMTKKSEIVPYFALTVFFLVSVAFTLSNFAQMMCVSFVPILTIITLKRIKRTKRSLLFSLVLGLYALAIICLLLLVHDKTSFVNELVAFFSDSGRSKLFSKALGLFIENPIFGTGMGNFPHIYPYDIRTNYHSSIIHPLATMGIVGLIAWLYYFVARVRVFTRDKSDFSFFMFIAFTLYQAYSLIDTGEYAFTTIYAVALVLVVEFSSNQRETELLPLYRDKNNLLCPSFFSFL